MADATPDPCRYSCSGHMIHPIQIRMAHEAGPPIEVEIIGEHEDGIIIAATNDPSHLETWCMHEAHRATIRAARAQGITTLRSFEHGFARIGDQAISHTSPEHWEPCPAPGELPPWLKGFFTRQDVERYLEAQSE